MNMVFQIVRADIVQMNVDAIVLPTNKSLAIGSGSSYSIFKKAGIAELQAACDRIDKTSLHTGDAVKTLAYGLKASIIVHAIVPKLGGAHNAEYDGLKRSYVNSLILADEEGCKSIAFPLLGAGNNGFDEKVAFYLAEEAISSYVASHNLQEVYLVIYKQSTLENLKESGVIINSISIDNQYISNHPNGAIDVLVSKINGKFKKIFK